MVSSSELYRYASSGKDIHQSVQLGVLNRSAGSVCGQVWLAMGSQVGWGHGPWSEFRVCATSWPIRLGGPGGWNPHSNGIIEWDLWSSWAAVSTPHSGGATNWTVQSPLVIQGCSLFSLAGWCQWLLLNLLLGRDKALLWHCSWSYGSQVLHYQLVSLPGLHVQMGLEVLSWSWKLECKKGFVNRKVAGFPLLLCKVALCLEWPLIIYCSWVGIESALWLVKVTCWDSSWMRPQAVFSNQSGLYTGLHCCVRL